VAGSWPALGSSYPARLKPEEHPGVHHPSSGVGEEARGRLEGRSRAKDMPGSPAASVLFRSLLECWTLWMRWKWW